MTTSTSVEHARRTSTQELSDILPLTDSLGRFNGTLVPAHPTQGHDRVGILFYVCAILRRGARSIGARRGRRASGVHHRRRGEIRKNVGDGTVRHGEFIIIIMYGVRVRACTRGPRARLAITSNNEDLCPRRGDDVRSRSLRGRPGGRADERRDYIEIPDIIWIVRGRDLRWYMCVDASPNQIH